MKFKPWLSTFFTGLSDGLIVPFSLITATSCFVYSSQDLIDLLMIIIPLAALLMAMSGYFTVRDQVYEQTTSLKKKSTDIKQFYANIGLNPEIQQQAADDHLKEKVEWDKISESSVPIQQPMSGAVTIFIAYMIGGSLSLTPFVIKPLAADALKLSAIVTLPALFIAGYFKYYFTGKNPWLGAIVLLLLGGLAAGSIYCIIKLFILR